MTWANVAVLTTVVDLVGQLSNPPEPLETLTPQGIADPTDRSRRAQESTKSSIGNTNSGGSEEPGQLSYPRRSGVQRRLSDAEIEHLAEAYRAGKSLADLAGEIGVHRRTIAVHLEQLGIPRRPTVSKLSTSQIEAATSEYKAGRSAAAIGATLEVDAATVLRVLRRAGVAIRPRRGSPAWHLSRAAQVVPRLTRANRVE